MSVHCLSNYIFEFHIKQNQLWNMALLWSIVSYKHCAAAGKCGFKWLPTDATALPNTHTHTHTYVSFKPMYKHK